MNEALKSNMRFVNDMQLLKAELLGKTDFEKDCLINDFKTKWKIEQKDL